MLPSMTQLSNSGLNKGHEMPAYLSPEVQNMLLHVMGDMLRKLISDSVRQAGFFSLHADESKDTSKKEQLAIVARYVDEKAILHE